MTQPAVEPWASQTDGELLAAFVGRRQEDAFAEIARRHGAMVLSVCRSVMGNTPDAEDAAQAVFLTLAQKAASLTGYATLAGWLHRVAWYVAARAAEAAAIRRRHEQEAARMRPDSAPAGDIPADLLHEGLAALPEKYRLPLLLHHFEGRTQEETAALLGCKLSAASMRLTRGREMLRQRLLKRGVTASALALAAVMTSEASASATTAFTASVAKAASAALAGQVASGVIPTTIMALSKGALNMLYWAKMKLVAVIVAAVVLTGGAVGTYVAKAGSATAKPLAAGDITEVGAASITLKPATGDAVVVTVDANTNYMVNGQAATLADVKVGMRGYAMGDAGKPATAVRAYVPKPPAPAPAPAPTQPSVAGDITALDASSVTIKPATGDAVVVSVDDKTTYKVGGQPAGFGELKVGMRAYALGEKGKPATEIRAYVPKPPTAPVAPPPAPPGVAGTITATGDGTITIKPNAGGDDVVVSVNDSTVVKINGLATATAADLKVGMRAYAVGERGKPATEVRAYTPKPPTAPVAPPAAPPGVSGVITDIGNATLTIKPNNGDAVTVTINDSTVVKILGKPAAASDLKVGMRAMALGETGKPATEIRAYPPAN